MYPVLLNVTGRPVLIVGGGKVAARKIKGLLKEKANITVISPTLHETIPSDRIKWIQRKYRSGDLNDYSLVFACTDDPLVNEQMMQDTSSQQWVNNTGNKAHSHFFNMKIIDVGDFTISVSSDGRDVKATKALGDRIKQWLITENMRGEQDENH